MDCAERIDYVPPGRLCSGVPALDDGCHPGRAPSFVVKSTNVIGAPEDSYSGFVQASKSRNSSKGSAGGDRYADGCKYGGFRKSQAFSG